MPVEEGGGKVPASLELVLVVVVPGLLAVDQVFLPGGGWPDLGGRIWHLGFIVAALELLWSELGVATAAIISSVNNRWFACFFFGAVSVGSPDPLSGHGGWGMWSIDNVWSWRWSGCCCFDACA
jgi:hypothetical protein